MISRALYRQLLLAALWLLLAIPTSPRSLSTTEPAAGIVPIGELITPQCHSGNNNGGC